MIQLFFIFVFQFLFKAIAYVLAPIFAAVRAIYVWAMIYSNKILDDIFPPDIRIMNQGHGAPQMKVVKSECCDAMIKAKLGPNGIEYLYCSKCKSKIDDKKLMNPNNEE